MQKRSLIHTLKELGFYSSEIKDLLLYNLNTQDRQEQMLAWLLANKDTCDKDSVRQKARDILRGFLASNPYNSAAKSMPVPKWEPPSAPKVKPAAALSPPPAQKSPVPTVKWEARHTEEDPFDRLMQIFTIGLRT